MSDIIPRSRLDLAALAVHRVLTDKGFTHIFFGGYELQVMGHERGTKDVDVLVKKPFFNGFDKVKQAFVDDSEFLVIEGNRSDAVREIHSTSSVGIDIMLWFVAAISRDDILTSSCRQGYSQKANHSDW
jgi:hypothetical protein